ncbi:MAG: sulfite exporter TauE/SafE family protein [Candidatus Omnitrophica bacterium]|nr:sulfite exporter TauE/SafE family protein [Candidatus Omnitrophota bacterium]
METIYTLTAGKFLLLLLSGFMIGISKTGIPGFGLLSITLTAMALPSRASTGVALVMLICGDIFAVTYYRRNAIWKYLFRLFPFTVPGIFIGYLVLGRINDAQLKPLIGIVILIMLGLNYLWKKNSNLNIPQRWYFAAILGLVAGITTMMANAAGPIMIIYLLAMNLDKKEFVGTGAWYFFIGNLVKVPFSAKLGLINPHSLRLNLLLLPGIICGAIIGILILKKISTRVFNIIVEVLTVMAATKLIF